MDGQMNILDANDTYCRLLGCTREEILGKSLKDFASHEFSRFISLNQTILLENEIKETEGQF